MYAVFIASISSGFTFEYASLNSLIIADDKSSPKFIVEDLISQAEHGNRTLCGVVSDSQNLLNRVEERLSRISSRKRIDQIREAKLFTVKVRSKKLAFRFVQAFAPEHLESMISSREVETITNSGLVLLGDYTPCSSTDYIVGTNHILPTEGTASKFAGLGVENFLKRVTLVKGGKKSLRRSSKYISSLALLEGFPNHASAAISRFDKRGEI